METGSTLTPRQTAIVGQVRKSGFASISMLADRFEVTTQTIRRDVADLCEAGILARYHGGVGLATSTENVPYRDRLVVRAEEKRAMAAYVAGRIPDRSSVFLNIGTTTEAVARALTGKTGLRVVTNNLNIAEILKESRDITIAVAGGDVRLRDGGIVGTDAAEFLSRYRLDFGVIGISGLDLDGSLLEFDPLEVRPARAILENARQIILVADSSKFGRRAMSKVARPEEIDVLVTDEAPPAELADALRRAGVKVEIVGRSPYGENPSPRA